MKKINILGTEYTVERRKADQDKKLGEYDGYCDTSIKLIVVEDFEPDDFSRADLGDYGRVVLRHEIIHAFMYESGLDGSSCSTNSWATNEEMIDWIAIQGPKLFKAFQESGCL